MIEKVYLYILEATLIQQNVVMFVVGTINKVGICNEIVCVYGDQRDHRDVRGARGIVLRNCDRNYSWVM